MSKPSSLRRRQRRARQSFISLAVSLIVLHLGLLIACEYVPRLRDPLFGDKQHLFAMRCENVSNPTVVLMIGSSRTGMGFHGLHIEKVLQPELQRPLVAFNFGVPAAGPMTHLIYLRRLLKEGQRPDLLFVEVLPSMFVEQKEGPLERNWFAADRFRGYEFAMVSRYGLDAAKYAPDWWRTFWNPWFGLRFQLLARIAPGWVPWKVRYDWGRGADAAGWSTAMTPTVTRESYLRGLTQATAEYQPILQDLHIGGHAVQALHDIIAIARDEGIPIRLVLMPEGTDFRRMYLPHVQARIDVFLKDLGVEVIDARRWLNDDQFTDGHHMLRSGAERFSEQLGREVILPFLKKSR